MKGYFSNGWFTKYHFKEKEGIFMTCIEAQALITRFIEDKLDEEQLLAFIKHMKQCPDCKDELEVYYTLIVGMHQLDNNEKLSGNFTEELDQTLKLHEERLKGKKRRLIQTKLGVSFFVSILLMSVLSILLWMLLNWKTTISEDEVRYPYLKVRQHLFYPPDSMLRNPYSNLEPEEKE